MTFRELNEGDRPDLETLLSENPHKSLQIRLQGLDREKLVRFHSDLILARSEKKQSPVWLLNKGSGKAVIGSKKLVKHTEYFGFPVYSIEPMITYALSPDDKKEAIREVITRFGERDGGVVWTSFEEAEEGLAEPFIEAGGNYCGTTLRLSCKLGPDPNIPRASDVEVREVTPPDLPDIVELARTSHHHSHFFRDPNLPSDRVADLFPQYVEGAFGKPNHSILVAESRDRRFLGFVLLICPKGQVEQIGKKVGILDFIVVDEAYQGSGVGKLLVEHTISFLHDLGYEFVELKTMLDNLAALRFYQRAGFQTLSAQMHFSIGLDPALVSENGGI